MTDDAERHVQIVEAYFEAIASQDPDRVATFYTEDYVLELPYFKPNEPLFVEGRSAVHAYLIEILARQRMQLVLSHSHSVPQENLLITGHTSTGEFTDTGEPYANRYIGYWTFRGDLISRLCEFYNPQVPGASAIG